MKITKTASGKTEVRISKSEWKNIGKKAGWDEYDAWDEEARNRGRDVDDAYDMKRDYGGDLDAAIRDREDQERIESDAISREKYEPALENICGLIVHEKIPFDILEMDTGRVIIPANVKVKKSMVLQLLMAWPNISMPESSLKNLIEKWIEKSGFQEDLNIDNVSEVAQPLDQNSYQERHDRWSGK